MNDTDERAGQHRANGDHLIDPWSAIRIAIELGNLALQRTRPVTAAL
jgi:hypothetical protein